MKYTFILGLTLILSCNRQESLKPQISDGTLKYACLAYGLRAAEPDIVQLKLALSEHEIYRRVKSDLDFARVQMLSSINENVIIFIIGMQTSNRLYAVKATRFKVLNIESEVLYTSQMKDNQNGVVGLLKDREAILIELKEGHQTIRALDDNEYRARFAQEDLNLAQFRFCQREKGQSFGDCFKHEAEEFCDSFWSCIALNTNPQVSVVIALACGCMAGADVPANLAPLGPGGIDTSRMLDTVPIQESPLVDSL